MSRHRVVVIGAGFGGLSATKKLGRADVDVTLIDRTNHHLFQPLLYQVATGILSSGDIAVPIRGIFRRQRNTEVVLGEVVDIDIAEKAVTVETFRHRTTVAYDSLIVATGSQQSYFGHPEFETAAPGMKSIDDALALRARIFGSFELAEEEPDPEVRRRLMTFVVIGAGPTGVEMAGQIAELSRRSLKNNYRRINPADARVILLDAAPRALGMFSESLQHNAVKVLTRLGVEVHLNAPVTGVDATGIDTGSENPALRRIDAATRIWAAGVEASSLGRQLGKLTGANVDKAGRIEINPDCTLPGHPEIFVIGDLMTHGSLPGVAEVAMQQGRYAARTITRRLAGQTEFKPFKYLDLGNMATISRFRAIADFGPFRATGFIGWLMWLFVHLAFLTGFKNRVAVVFNWLIAFLGSGRPQRVFSTRQIPHELRE
ncbi:NAD(P)/FAD-dependent oxidoreductase [Streptosporangiaceae bacterium NEAU-GS5]|nr:NAD(P)/FAD-dependent oxidoreductase [Streptosporangiaceae bacterium NEAU-GS5]